MTLNKDWFLLFGATTEVRNGDKKYPANYYDMLAAEDIHQWMFPHGASLSQLWMWPEVNANGTDMSAFLSIDGSIVATRSWNTTDKLADISGSVWDLNIAVIAGTQLQLRVTQGSSVRTSLATGITGTWLRD